MLGSEVDAQVSAWQPTNQTQQRKACNCRNSKCLKLYCECFASGVYCVPGHCNCNPCQNNLQYEEVRQQAVQQILERTPSAFRPKINTMASAISSSSQKTSILGLAQNPQYAKLGAPIMAKGGAMILPSPNGIKPPISKLAVDAASEKTHAKGCACKKSACLKKYCECF